LKATQQQIETVVAQAFGFWFDDDTDTVAIDGIRSLLGLWQIRLNGHTNN
jgi:hypothetical protein